MLPPAPALLVAAAPGPVVALAPVVAPGPALLVAPGPVVAAIVDDALLDPLLDEGELDALPPSPPAPDGVVFDELLQPALRNHMTPSAAARVETISGRDSGEGRMAFSTLSDLPVLAATPLFPVKQRR
jgi:hypothetical protein